MLDLFYCYMFFDCNGGTEVGNCWSWTVSAVLCGKNTKKIWGGQTFFRFAQVIYVSDSGFV